MKIVFVTTTGEDYLQDSILHGMRSLIHEDCVDFPRKKILYQDWSEKNKNELHGRGFSMYSAAISEIQNRELDNADFVLYGVSKNSNDFSFENPKINSLVCPSKIWHLDGHDLYGGAYTELRTITHDNEAVIGVQKTPCFKRELIEEVSGAYPIGFGIPSHNIRSIDITRKKQFFQKTAPHDSVFLPVNDMGGGFRHHSFINEDDYYADIQDSWFGLTCKKGGWDCLRHYEIMAAGSLLLFKDYHKKPPLCSPIGFPTISYSSEEELFEIMNKLVINNKPTEKYISLLREQRKWLINHGTTTARALSVFNTLNDINTND